MNLSLGQYALVGFGLALAVHACVLLGIDIGGRWPVVWVLDIGLFALFVPVVFSFAPSLWNEPAPAPLYGELPAWAVLAGLGLVAYEFVNVACFAYGAITDSPELDGGNFLTVVQGKAIHVVASSTYTALRASVLRVRSGYWLVSYFAAFVYFTFGRKTGPARDEEKRRE